MAWFQLDPQSIAARAHTKGCATSAPTLAASISRGVIGFALVSVAGFSPWAFFDRWFHRVGEVGLYAACTAVFIGLSGLLLHRLIIGRGSLPRFYKLFSIAFAAYAIVWITLWVWLHGNAGSVSGLLGGTVAMGMLLAFAFDAQRSVVKIVAALFVLNALGYFAGGWVEGKLAIGHRLAGMILWGVCYGVGFGAGLGIAFYICQANARSVMGATSARNG